MANKNEIPGGEFNRDPSFKSHLYFGSHPAPGSENNEYVFRVNAEFADSVHLCGDFCGWDEGIPMKRISDGIWEAVVKNVNIYDCYKYKIYSQGRTFYKADPYAFHAETPDRTASKIFDISGYEWHDSQYLSGRKTDYDDKGLASALNIYELHFGSWKKKEDGNSYSYREMASELAPYVKKMGYTHIELLPMAEHMNGEIPGYSATEFFAPTSRYGTPYDFMYFIDEMHKAGIGVILDWNPSCFDAKAEQGLSLFDGTPMFEYPGTSAFDLRKKDVKDFLLSNAMYWVQMYHVDGLKVHGVRSMLCGDNYDKNSQSAKFFKELSRSIKKEYPDVMLISGDAVPECKLCGLEKGGLGFDLEFDTLRADKAIVFASTESVYRNPAVLTDAEPKVPCVLAVSHRELLSSGKSLPERMPGDYNRKFDCVRALMLYLMTFPGKKLSFMGNETGQFAIWDFNKSTEWFLLRYESHRRLQKFVSDMNNLYLARSELWEQDFSQEGFRCLVSGNEPDVVAYLRFNKQGEGLLCIFNFSCSCKNEFKLEVPFEAVFTKLINSDDEQYMGKGRTNVSTIKPPDKSSDGNGYTLSLNVPANCGMIFSAEKNAISKKRAVNMYGRADIVKQESARTGILSKKD